MSIRTNSLVLGIGVLLLAGTWPTNVAASEIRMSAATMTERFNDCKEREKKVSALVLIDESMSLGENQRDKSKATDPKGDRVPALLQAVDQLLWMADDADIRMAVSGFGADYYKRIDWMSVTDENQVVISNEIKKSGTDPTRFDDKYTKYDVALRGASDQFSEIDKETPSCHVLIWFSDGRHDSTNSGKATLEPSEISEIENKICNPGGLADQLRLQNVMVNPVGLANTGVGKSANEVGLMQLIAERDGSYINGKTFTRCGEEEPFGKFLSSLEPTELLDVIWAESPGAPTSQVAFQSCRDGSLDCSEIVFTADSTVKQFVVRLSTPNPEVEVQLSHDSSQVFDVFGPAFEDDLVEIKTYYDSRAAIEVKSLVPGDLAGTWKIQSVGPNAEQVTARTRFIGAADVSLAGDLRTLSRPDGTDISLSVANGSDSEIIQSLGVSLQVAGGSEPIEASSAGSGMYEISAATVRAALAKPVLATASNVALEIQPTGFIGGLKDTDGNSVEVEYEPRRFQMSIALGDKYPSFLRYDGEPKVKNTDDVTIDLWFTGPDTGSGKIRFTPMIDENEFGFDYAQIPADCNIEPKEEKKCPITLRPNRDGSETVQFTISYTPISADNTEADPQEITVEIAMTRNPDASKGVIAFVEYLAVFLGVIALVRFFFALLLSRFSPLEATARRVRIPVTVDVDGAVSAPGGRFIADVSDGAFAFEVAEAQRRFEMLGYEFTSSVWKTFKGSTTTPLGQVSKYGTFIFGSRGFSRSRKSLAEVGTQGLVDLSLRSQWSLAIPNAEMMRLVNGDTFADAEVIAFLDPFELKELGGQLIDLEFSVTGSSVPADIRNVLDQLKVVEPSEVVDELGMPDPADPFTTASAPSDPFDNQTFNNESHATPGESGRGMRFKRKKSADDQELEPPSSGSDPSDPFV